MEHRPCSPSSVHSVLGYSCSSHPVSTSQLVELCFSFTPPAVHDADSFLLIFCGFQVRVDCYCTGQKTFSYVWSKVRTFFNIYFSKLLPNHFLTASVFRKRSRKKNVARGILIRTAMCFHIDVVSSEFNRHSALNTFRPIATFCYAAKQKEQSHSDWFSLDMMDKTFVQWPFFGINPLIYGNIPPSVHDLWNAQRTHVTHLCINTIVFYYSSALTHNRELRVHYSRINANVCVSLSI